MTKLTHEQIREKYFNLVKTVGVDKTISQLHREIGNRQEQNVFEGGYDRDRLAEVQFLRELSRDIYNYQLELDSKKYQEKK